MTSLLTVTPRPFNAETPLETLRAGDTPARLFFVRSNFDVPLIDAAAWELELAGMFATPRRMTLAELQALRHRTVQMTMECAGNGRRLMRPVPPGTAWGLGAVSTGTFTGAALHDVLELCGLDAAATGIVFEGADAGVVEDATSEEHAASHSTRFVRSLPRERALHPDTLLVWAMNGAPLMPEHGHPVRLLVPGYYGVASVKWLVRIIATDTPFSGHFQTDRYIYRGHPAHPDDTPVTTMEVRALISEPVDGAEVDELRTVRGIAWSGAGAITAVDVSVDGGATWRGAVLEPAASPYAAAGWRVELNDVARLRGSCEILARATDSAGNVQPLEPVWNELGYGNNVVQRVTVVVRER